MLILNVTGNSVVLYFVTCSVKQKFGFNGEAVFRLVMENDGTNVEIDRELLRLLGATTTYVVLLDDEQWQDAKLANEVRIKTSVFTFSYLSQQLEQGKIDGTILYTKWVQNH